MEVDNVPSTTTKSKNVNFNQISRSYLDAITEMQMPKPLWTEHPQPTEYQKSVYAIEN